MFEAKGTLCLHAFGKELIVHVLHDHVGALHVFLWLLRLSVSEILAGCFPVQTAERTGKGRFPRAVVSDDGDDLSGRGPQGNILQNRLLLIRKGHILQLQYRRCRRRGIASLYSQCAGVEMQYGWLLLYLFLASIIGQFGDLAMSTIKRTVGIKDFSRVLPGHGGILDRFDSFLFAAPFAVLYGNMTGCFL